MNRGFGSTLFVLLLLALLVSACGQHQIPKQIEEISADQIASHCQCEERLSHSWVRIALKCLSSADSAQFA